MSLWKIALRSVQHRLLQSLLTMFSIALGVTMVIAVLTIVGVIEESFTSNASLGYNMIVGAKGGKQQLTLNTVYYLSAPVQNIPYDYYLEFMNAEQRTAELRTAIRVRAHAIRQTMAGIDSIAAITGGAGPVTSLTTAVSQAALERAAARQLDAGRDGKFAQYIEFAIPVCLGDYLGNFRVVGTTPEFFERLRFGEDADRKYEFAAGRNLKSISEEHGYFEAVLGSTVARELRLKVGDEIAPAHGSVDGHKHAQMFTVVGILRPTGTPNDRAAFINMEGFYLMEDHAEPMTVDKEAAKEQEALKEQETAQEPHGGGGAVKPDEESRPITLSRVESRRVPLPVEQRQVTALLVLSKRTGSLGLHYIINRPTSVAQAVFPIQEVFSLFDTFVRPAQLAFLALTIMICFVSSTNIVVGIYNSMSERRREIAVIRALGAGRSTVMSIILLESIILAVGGGGVGMALGHTGIALASPVIEEKLGVTIGFSDLAPGPKLGDLLQTDSTNALLQWKISPEVVVLPAMILLAIGAGFLPAVSAYRTDVSQSLGS